MSDSVISQKSSEKPSAKTLVRVLIVAATLALAWVLGQSPSWFYMGFIAVLAGILILLRCPQLGILSIIPLALMVPFSIGTGTQTGLHLAFLAIPLMCVIVFFRNVYSPHSWKPLLSREFLPLLGLVLTASVAFVAGYLPWNVFAHLAPIRAQLGELAIFAFSAGAFILVALVFDSERWLQALVWMFIIIGSIYMVGRAFPPLSSIAAVVVRDATGSVFWLWLVALAAGQALFNQKLRLSIRALLVGLVALIFFVAFILPAPREWASGWLPAGVCLGVIIWLRWPKLSIAFGVLAALTLAINLNTVAQFLLSGDNAYSLLTRSAASQILWQIIQVNPLLGLGPANYYYYTPLYSILGYYVSFNSHNQYIDIVAQTGFVGLIFFFWFAWQISRLCWKLRSVVSPNSFAVGYIHASLGGLAGMLVAGVLGDWVIPFVYNIGVAGFRASLLGWLFLGGVVALSYINQKSALPEDHS